MQTVKAVKLVLKADEEIFRVLDGQSRICNWLYNHLLEKTNQLKSEFIEHGTTAHAKTIYSERGLRNLLPAIKEENQFLKSVHSSPLKNTALRLSSSIQAHQKTKKGKRKGISGWPGYRSWKAKWMSLFYDEPNKGYKVAGDILTLSLGTGIEKKRHSIQFHLKDTHLLEGQSIRNLRITKDAGIYYAVFTVSINLPKKKLIQSSIALDPNHKNFAYGVDDNGHSIEIAAPSWLKTYDRRIDELKSKRDRCLKKAKQHSVVDHEGHPTGKTYYTPSRRWKKYHTTIEKALHKRREQTKTFMFTLAHCLCSKYDCIGIGDYAPNGEGITAAMRRAMNNRSLIGRFKEILIWTAEKSGKTAFEYDEKGTTRTCHACGYIHENGLAPSIRKWDCPSCQISHIRDENAAKNGLRNVLRDIKTKCETFVSSVPGSGLVSVVKQWAWCVRPSGVRNILQGHEQRAIAAPGN